MSNVVFVPGWKPTPASVPRVRLEAVLRPAAVKLPAFVDHLNKVKYVGMMLNDSLGDCTVAADGHIIQGLTYYGQGNEVVVPDSAVLTGYEASGYNPKARIVNGVNPTDQGWTVEAALGYLQQHGLAGHKIAFYGQLEVSDESRLKQAVYEFGYLSIGLNLPSSAMDQFNAGPVEGAARPVWGVVKDDGGILGGHCVAICGYNGAGPVAWTWGASVQLTWAFWKKYVEEAWGVVSLDWVNTKTGTDPDGVNMQVLGEEVAAIFGSNPF